MPGRIGDHRPSPDAASPLLPMRRAAGVPSRGTPGSLPLDGGKCRGESATVLPKYQMLVSIFYICKGRRTHDCNVMDLPLQNGFHRPE